MKHSKKGLCHSPCLTLAALILLAAPAHTFAQDSSSNPPAAPPSQPKKPDPKPAKPAADSATQNAPDQPMWDPLRAEKDMQVGIYYMHKGDLDAAIDRFQDAALAKPGYALPFLRLGEAQEKKGLKRQAVKSYQRYLDLYPQAGDKDKIQKKIDKLYKEVEKDKKSM
ncbi:MAG: tetratricopeptide repeat protein [Candidatus Acidiferrum sp.]